MNDPVIADKKNVILELEQGACYWCSCGRSQNQHFCDGSHQTTEFTPLPLAIGKKKQVAPCNCKRTNNAPYCDGTHSTP